MLEAAKKNGLRFDAVNLPLNAMERVDQALQVARGFKPLSEQEVFDGTFRNPEWLGPTAAAVLPALHRR